MFFEESGPKRNLNLKENLNNAIARLKEVHARGSALVLVVPCNNFSQLCATQMYNCILLGGGLIVMTGAGMSVQSGVPVFRNSDGSMSKDFLRFLAGYNKARAGMLEIRRPQWLSVLRHLLRLFASPIAAGQPTVDDWFGFSVPEMFDKSTAKEGR